MTGPAPVADTWGAFRRRSEQAPLCEAARLIGPGGLVVIAPHPDDESIGASGLLVAAEQAGRRVGLAALTDGDASHDFPREALAELRRREQAAAMRALGCGDAPILRLGLPDGGSSRDPGFAGAAGTVAAFLDEIGADTLAAPHPDDPHPDHHAAADLALAVRALRPALRLLFYPVWSLRLADAAPYRGADLTPFRIATDAFAKIRAIACHESQLGTVKALEGRGFVLPDAFIAAHSTGVETVSWAAMPGRPPEPAHFERLYAGDGDPWHVRSSAYEAGKREATIGILGDLRCERALELGCGEGHLTAALATHARQIVAVDRDAGIVERARRVHGDLAGARFVEAAMPRDLPSGPFDLVVLSEVLYFLDEAALGELAQTLRAAMRPGAALLLCNYLGATGTPLSGRDAADVFVSLFGRDLEPVSRAQTDDYLAEHLRFRPRGPEGRADGA
ncbi:bifunctional PIG-L family deacetylase/class I SAM-dependent methyltransferase [Aurantimonas sp. Leaf443]|uniref:bifunctional PIG-L family deacetylase/class I SAM-dependent methyltransferase n=1 Tax=Aurantimonas sp. Leaf443 TaxID=1736378 RepID=UPI0006F3CCC5|nr:bifunctional PIG-L family deacetylase/class I SAM-dependent methyltransferase [Aurantimonas sp. Leaf443]KQT87429.1 hypothetical protein ASG48_16640 [Aurantimonas sp. Leaf443]